MPKSSQINSLNLAILYWQYIDINCPKPSHLNSNWHLGFVLKVSRKKSSKEAKMLQFFAFLQQRKKTVCVYSFWRRHQNESKRNCHNSFFSVFFNHFHFFLFSAVAAFCLSLHDNIQLENPFDSRRVLLNKLLSLLFFHLKTFFQGLSWISEE